MRSLGSSLPAHHRRACRFAWGPQPEQAGLLTAMVIDVLGRWAGSGYSGVVSGFLAGGLGAAIGAEGIAGLLGPVGAD
ncbi:hypothetical protein H6G65_17995 [Microcystis elabens FACHB-917]|nr:hypothetical protein [Microcystis elabens FACHB-917]